MQLTDIILCFNQTGYCNNYSITQNISDFTSWLIENCYFQSQFKQLVITSVYIFKVVYEKLNNFKLKFLITL